MHVSLHKLVYDVQSPNIVPGQDKVHALSENEGVCYILKVSEYVAYNRTLYTKGLKITSVMIAMS